MNIRVASSADADFVASCFVSIVKEMQQTSSDPYIDGLLTEVDNSILELSLHLIQSEQGIVLIAEADSAPIGCLAGQLQETSMPVSNQGRVGNITICWVQKEFRKQGIASKLTLEVEQWFIQQQVDLVELSYMTQNTLASTSWKHLGYSPFRTFAYKKLNNQK